jgi:hypothetical protein
MTTINRIPSRRALAASLAIASVAAAGVPAGALAASSSSSTKTLNYPVTVKKGILASGTKVSTRTVVTNPESSVSDWWNGRTIVSVVRTGVNGKYQSPYNAQGYQCTPTVSAKSTKFVCKLQGADVPTTVRLTFTANYA